MKIIALTAMTFVALALIPTEITCQDINFDPMLNVFKKSLQGIVDSINGLKKVVADLSRQTMLQQFAMEERSRINSGSGIKSIRSRNKGLKNYESDTHTGSSVFAIHDHSNHLNTIGMGELSVLMNGVNFCTRHNDYKLVMPSTTSTDFRATEPIPFPEVPPSVTGSIEDQVKEMAEWLRAFKEQNHTVRDYRKYFKPALCYLEGTWTLDKELQEPFSSDRHKLDASSWFGLQEKVMFSSYSGTKNSNENFAYLPTSIMSVNKTTGESNYGQWNYRILCKPTKVDVPLSMLKHVDDLSYRMRDGRSVDQALNSRSARFKLYDESRSDGYQLLDELFYDIPGLDNLPDDNMTQASYANLDLYDVIDKDDQNVPLKTGYYHRQYKYIKRGAMGLNVNPRGFNDENLWVAQTSQPRVAPMGVKVCKRVRKPKRGSRMACSVIQNRFSYAIPLEIIYLTPILSWNPYNLQMHQDLVSSAPTKKENGATVPYQGVHPQRFYMAPYEIFQTRRRGSRTPADTTRGVIRVMDRSNKTRMVVASGTRIFMDEIKSVGKVRLRYPIAPVADEGSSVWKELTALKDYLATMQTSTETLAHSTPREVVFEMSTSSNSSTAPHSHTFTVPYQAYLEMVRTGMKVKVVTDQAEGHSHVLRIRYLRAVKTFRYELCDNKSWCFDRHPKSIIMTTTNLSAR